MKRPAQKPPLALGLDFGTLSARALLVETATGREVAAATHSYRSGVISETIPGTSRTLQPETALQDPSDYLESLCKSVRSALKKAGAKASDVASIGTDFTCCTILPTRANGMPLSYDPKFRCHPGAWVKLWKHHAAQPEAHEINHKAAARKEHFIECYGGKYSSEWFFSKVLETLRDSPAVYKAADRFIEAGDWITWQLTGHERRNASAAGFKAMAVCPDGFGGWTYPSRQFFRALDPRLENVVLEKLSTDFYPLGSSAGGLTEGMARITGLNPGTPVAVGNIDAHAGVPACGVTRPGTLVMIMGTSTCHMLIARNRKPVEGVCGVVEDGIVPGLWSYEAGQSGVGDIFSWFANNACPGNHSSEAAAFKALHEPASKLAPGESGLLALDWWNGNRSVLMDATLSGLLVGMTLGTRPHHIYRALIEATAFGTRAIIEAFTRKGIRIDALCACGGLAQNPLIMQIYADVTGRPIQVAASAQASALGAAMQGTVAAGVFPDIHAAAESMVQRPSRIYHAHAASNAIYNRLYSEYIRLHDEFGRNPSSAMKRLRTLRDQVLGLTTRKQKRKG